MMNAITLPGFVEPVRDAQRCFRAVLEAMARPGSIHSAGVDLTPPSPMDNSTAAVLLTLVDGETPLWIASPFAPVRDWVTFHCGATVVQDKAKASFVLTPTLPDLTLLAAGSHEAPETGTTVIAQVAALGRGTRYRLRGPGLRVPSLLQVNGLPPQFAAIWQSNHARFPCGVDLLLCCGTQLAALPRSVTVEEA
jgi:alpha-D-ribose 1-methylphosphonate 5-triphosphate synthase subunit PhnH